MPVETIILGLALVFGFYMAWSIGANDVANAMGTSVGSGALTLKRAVILAAILEFAGAFLVGAHVSETVRKGIISPTLFEHDQMIFVFGMMASLLAAAAWLQLATFFGWPVSTTHSIVGAIVGFGAIVGGMDAVNWGKVGSIVASWVVSPLLAGAISFLIFKMLLRRIFYTTHPVESAKKLTPVLTFFVFGVLTLVLAFKGLKNLKLDLPLWEALAVAAVVGIIAGFISHLLVRGVGEDRTEAEKTAALSPRLLEQLQKARRALEKADRDSSGEIQYQTEQLREQIEALTERVRSGVETDHRSKDFKTVERIFVSLQILSACFVAFAHGANDVANAIGPLAAVVTVLQTGVVAAKAPVPMWLLGLGGVGIVVGLATWGWRVIETVGKKITELSPSRGFAAEFGAATTIVVASKFGLPISTTHTLVGAVLGVGMARGIGALNLNVMRDIAASWLITLPAGAGLAVVFYYILRAIFG